MRRALPSGVAECPQCDPSCPELDEDGHAYTCYFCCDTGRVPQDVADAYWQAQTDSVEYRRLLPVIDGKHQQLRCDDEGDCWVDLRPLLPSCLMPKPAPAAWAPEEIEDIPF